MATIKDKILIIVSAVGAFFAAVFYVLFKQAKDEQQIAEDKLQEQRTRLAEIQDTVAKEHELKELKKEVDKREKDTISDIDTDRPLSDILSDLANRSKDRNH